MGFKLSKDTSYKWPVTVKIPRDGGKFVNATFNAEFAYLGQEDLDQVFDNARNNRDNSDVCMRALVGWGKEVTDENDQPIEYSEQAKSMLLNVPYFKHAVLLAFTESITGDAGRRKN